MSPQRRTPTARLAARAALTLVVFAVVGSPALAIPTPDVVIHVFTGMAQGLVVLAATMASLGVAFLRALRRPGELLRKTAVPGMLLLLVGSVSFNWYQMQSSKLDRLDRLSRNLVRASTQNGRTVKDVSLELLPFDQQLHHPLGLDTAEVAALVAGAKVLLVDVREDEEYASGAIRGTRHVRYPDLAADPALLAGRDRPPVLLCYSGNRSSELAEAFSERGAECRFMVGGYEKWSAEGREIEGRLGEPDARDIADYPNMTVLLDTPEVERLYHGGDVVFIDARYPSEFNASHLPNAINLPLRMLPSDELEAALAGVPRGKQLVGLGYDQRSSFYALLLGSKLVSRGHDWLGRYTVPAEFMEPAPSESGAAPSISERVSGWMTSGLGFLARRSGSAALAVILMVLALRLLLLPASLKSEASVAATRRARPGLGEREGAAGERRRTNELSNRAGGGPLWSLVTGLAQAATFVTLATVLATSDLLRGAPLSSTWIRDLSLRDPLYVLPLLVGALALAQMKLSGHFRERRGTTLAVLLGLVFIGLTAQLPAAINLAIVVNLLFSLGLSAAFARREWRAQQSAVPERLRRCEQMLVLRGAHTFQGVGPKASRLARMAAAGLPVPDGFVLPHGFLERAGDPSTWSRPLRARLLELFDRLGAETVAVRSSALDEDGEEKSFAGMFESVLDVERTGLLDAASSVLRSIASEPAGGGACILVQRMIDADHAGVMFTRHPAHPAEMAIEYVGGCGAKLVSGEARPAALSVGRLSGELLGDDAGAPPFDWTTLVQLGRRLEALFGRPQDVEWCVKDGRIFLVQSRDITASALDPRSEAAMVERERGRLLALTHESGQPLQLEGFSELNPAPTASSRSLIEAMLGPGGAAEQARARYGAPFAAEHAHEALTTAYGRLYTVSAALRRLYPSRGVWNLVKGLRAASRMHRDRARFDAAWMQRLVRDVERDVRLETSMDLARLELPDLAEVLERRVDQFTKQHYARVDELNLVVSYQESRTRSLLQKSGLSVAAMEGARVQSVTAEGGDLLRRVAQGRAELEDYLAEFGHRAPCDYELSTPRFSEDVRPVQLMLRALADAPERRETAVSSEIAALPAGERAALAAELTRFAELSASKETARHHVLKSLATVREALTALGRRAGLGDDVFHLRIEECLRLARSEQARLALGRRAAERRRRREILLARREVEGLAELGVHELERLGRSEVRFAEGDLHGTCIVRGEGPVEGLARVLRNDADRQAFRAGEVLVVVTADTSLAPLMGRAAALVTEVGGALSHAAIVARESRLPATFGVPGATRRIRTGDRLRLAPDGRVIVLESAGRDRADRDRAGRDRAARSRPRRPARNPSTQ